MKKFNIDYMMDYEDGDGPQPSPVRVVEYEDEEVKEALIDGDEIITQSSVIQIKFEYPLHNSTTLTFTNEGKPFTRKCFWQAIFDGYTRIYREEDEAAGPTGTIPGMYNRETSVGPYGIWGHIIEDLFIEGVVEKKKNFFTLQMGS